MKPIMTKTKARQWLKAVISLREYYEGKNAEWVSQCPLCFLGGFYTDPGCPNCLWTLFEGKRCKPETGGRRYLKKPWWVAKSIPRLRRWERRLKRIMGK